MSYLRVELLFNLRFIVIDMPTCLIEHYHCWLRVGDTRFLLFPHMHLDPAPLHDSLPVCTGRVGTLLISSNCCVLFVDRSAP